MDKKSIYFDDWLEEHLANESQEYREEFEKELFKMDLAVQIKELRTEQKLSQREFAKKVGVSQSTIANIELGNAEPNIDTMYEIGRKNNKKLTISYS
ncbi:helix-turn-helix transcriptional regulator [Enterococcus olivae]